MSHFIMNESTSLNHDDTDERKNPRLGFIILLMSALATVIAYYIIFKALSCLL